MSWRYAELQALRTGSKLLVKDSLLTIKAMRAPAGRLSRLVVVASKRIGGAVVRNRCRRRIKEVFRCCFAKCFLGTDLLVIVKTDDCATVSISRIEELFSKAYAIMVESEF